MRPSPGFQMVLLLALAASACRVAPASVTGPQQHVVVAASSPPTVAATPGQASASATLPAAFLKAPTGDFTALEGQVLVDASYLVASHAASLLQHGGGPLLTAGGALIANNGGSLISNNGGGLIANNAGNVIANNAGNLISDGGGNLLSDHGAGLLSDAGGGLISEHGGALVGNNAAGLRSLFAAPAPPSFGLEANAAGMQLQAVNMETGKQLALGVDPAGHPVYSIYTNLNGHYQVYLPKAQAANVRLVAGVPDNTDPRAVYGGITAPAAGSLRVDEDVATTTRLLRQTLHNKFLNILKVRAASFDDGISDDEIDEFIGHSQTGGAQKEVLVGLLKQLGTALRANTAVTSADYPALAFLLGDLMLSQTDLAAIQIDEKLLDAGRVEAFAHSSVVHSGGALAAMAAIVKDLREHVVTLGAGKSPREMATLFAAKPYILRANTFHAHQHPEELGAHYVIERASDLADFLALEYFSLVTYQSYGCTLGVDCAASTPKPSKAPKGASPTPDPCDLRLGCFPSGGFTRIESGEITNLARAVAIDVGSDPAGVDVLSMGTASITTAVGVYAADPRFQSALICLIQGFKHDGGVCEVGATDAVATP